MVFTSTMTHRTVSGNLRIEVWEWNSAGVTSGNIDTGLGKIVHTNFENKTAQRGTVDDTTTSGRVALTGLTSNDVGRVVVYGT